MVTWWHARKAPWGRGLWAAGSSNDRGGFPPVHRRRGSRTVPSLFPQAEAPEQLVGAAALGTGLRRRTCAHSTPRDAQPTTAAGVDVPAGRVAPRSGTSPPQTAGCRTRSHTCPAARCPPSRSPGRQRGGCAHSPLKAALRFPQVPTFTATTSTQTPRVEVSTKVR